MQYVNLGKSNIKVSRLCFGSLTIGPLQANMNLDDGAALISSAFEMGVNFIDTAELYKTYTYIGKAIAGRRNRFVISTKSYAYDKTSAQASLKKALRELGTDYIDIFSLHEQESEHTLRGHSEALEFLIQAKEKGIIRSIGISTHAIAAVEGALRYPEIEVIHPIINKEGLGIIDGSRDQMLEAIHKAAVQGKGIYSMKALGGGNLYRDNKACFEFVLKNQDIHSVAVGMQSMDELQYNVAVFEGREVPRDTADRVKGKERSLLVDFWCKGCGKCVEKCGQQALSIHDGKAIVKKEKCLTCGYCSAHCPDFCLKII